METRLNWLKPASSIRVKISVIGLLIAAFVYGFKTQSIPGLYTTSHCPSGIVLSQFTQEIVKLLTSHPLKEKIKTVEFHQGVLTLTSAHQKIAQTIPLASLCLSKKMVLQSLTTLAHQSHLTQLQLDSTQPHHVVLKAVGHWHEWKHCFQLGKNINVHQVRLEPFSANFIKVTLDVVTS